MLSQMWVAGPPSLVFLLLIALPLDGVLGYGSSGSIAAAFGENGFFCAIDAAGKQEVICWGKKNKSSDSLYFSSLPPMIVLSGGEGFMCGITTSSQAYCWSLANPGTDLVPQNLQNTLYSQIAAGKYHVCAIRGSYYSGIDFGEVDCWGFVQSSANSLNMAYDNATFRDSRIDSLSFRRIVSGEGFSFGVVRDGSVVCWGPESANLTVPSGLRDFETLASGRGSVCGISGVSGELQCWGKSDEFGSVPYGTNFVGLSAGASHFCGVREDDHGVECWGSIDSSASPKASGFLAVASSDFTTCGVREVDLVLDCWGVHGQSPPEYSPPLQLCSPGVCSVGSCSAGKFAFNASMLNEPDLSSLCVQKDMKICLPCGTTCSEGYFPSSSCSKNADRICTACSFCQSSSCWNVCGLPPATRIREVEFQEIKKLVVIIASSISGCLLILLGWFVIPHMMKTTNDESSKTNCTLCVGKQAVERSPDPKLESAASADISVVATQLFRLSELKDATHGFKEVYELGRGSFGFVYKAALADGRQVAVKRANAATIIHTNNRDFEAKLEILCNIRHRNIVNLLGYCAEMGERLLVYEFMPHGTLSDHLHGELSPLDWNLRLKICLQAARGLEYLHKEVTPPVVHQDLKTSNILLDSEWEARIADFGLLRDLNGDTESDVFSFGIILLEILSGRKAYEKESSPPDIAEWALPLIRKGRAAAIVDRNIMLPKNVEPLLRLADIAELALRESPSERPTMSEIVRLLDQNMKTGLS